MMRCPILRARIALAAAASLVSAGLLPALARAQTSAPAANGGAANTGTLTSGQLQQTTQPGATYVPSPSQLGASQGVPSSPSPPGTIGGGNATESSAHPLTGDQEDTFDLSGGNRSSGAAHGSENGPIFTVGGPSIGGEVPGSHIVRRGDTLWGICDYYFKNPYQWPRVWSYNAQVKNPNWIYPGDELRLNSGAEPLAASSGNGSALPYDPSKMTLVERRRRVPNDTVFLRDQGWIKDDADEAWGEISGSAEETMFLSDLNEVYISLRKGHNIQVGQELTVFHTRQTAVAGAIVQILGTVRVNEWNPTERVARGQVVETLDVIERGAKVGPVLRSFAVVPPRRNDAEVEAHVLASIHPNELFGQNQIVFIDKGEADGLRPGNRLFVVRHGDAWRQTLVSADSSFRISADDERPMPPMEKTPGSRRDDDRYPEEVFAELRVLAVKKASAVCLVTQARHEIEPHDVAHSRKGY